MGVRMASLEIFRNIDDSVVTLDDDGRVSSWNPRTEELYGLSWEFARGKRLDELFEIRGPSLAEILGCVASDGSWREDVVHVVGDQSIEVNWSVSRFKGEGASTILIARRHRRQREILQRSVEIAQSAELAANMGSWAWTPGSDRIEWSDNLCSIHELLPEDFRGTTEHVASFIHPDDQQMVLDASACLQEEPSTTTEISFRIVTTSGATKQVHGYRRLIRDCSGEVTLVVGVLIDITERREADQARRTSDLNYTRVLAHSPDAVVSIDENHNISVFNRSAEELFGYAASEVVGKPLALLLPEGVQANHSQLVDAFTADEIPNRPMSQRSEIRGRRKDGSTFSASASITSQLVNGERVMTAFVRDLSAQKDLERRYLQSQKMEAVGRLAGGIAHDFNNMLSGMICFATLIREGLDEGEDVKEDVGSMLECCDRASDLTKQLLSFSRSDLANLVQVNVCSTVTELMRLLERMIGEDISLNVSLAEESSMVQLPAGNLEQIVMNLVVNARDAMPQGGRLTIKTRIRDIQSASGLEPGAYIEMLVSDSGHGMDADTRDRVFEPFFTTKQPGQGTGLGLATVYGIVDQAGGRISVESYPGHGTFFTLLLPICLATPAIDDLMAPEPEVASEAQHRSIFVVEDDFVLRQLVRRVLTKQGYAVTTAADGRQALDMLLKAEVPPDLLLTDIVMPQMSGFELAGNYRDHSPDTQVLFMSGYTDEVVVAHGYIKTGASLLRKPFTPDALLAAVSQATSMCSPPQLRLVAEER